MWREQKRQKISLRYLSEFLLELQGTEISQVFFWLPNFWPIMEISACKPTNVILKFFRAKTLKPRVCWFCRQNNFFLWF